MTPEERALLNDTTMLGSRDRSFCGMELQPITAKNRRYIERMMSILGQLRYSPTEVSLVYAYLLTIPVVQLRSVCRDMDALDAAVDKFMEKLPDPVPEAEQTKLSIIVDGDIKEIQAAQFEVAPKPGDNKPEPDEPPNA